MLLYAPWFNAKTTYFNDFKVIFVKQPKASSPDKWENNCFYKINAKTDIRNMILLHDK